MSLIPAFPEKCQKDLEDLRNAPSAEEERGRLKKRLMDINQRQDFIKRLQLSTFYRLSMTRYKRKVRIIHKFYFSNPIS